MLRRGSGWKDARVLILGYAYLENSDDIRNSPSAVLVSLLQERGARVVIHDPYVAGYGDDLYDLAIGCEAVILMVKHQIYSEIDFWKLKRQLLNNIIVDGRGILPVDALQAMGYRLITVGRSSRIRQSG